MDVRDLAPALVAFADLLTAANKEVNGVGTELRVEVSTKFKAGSFGIDLSVSQQLLSQIKEIFSGNGATAISNAYTIVTLVGFTGGGLIGILRILKGRRPVRVEEKGDVAAVWITESECVEVSDRIMRLYRSIAVRRSLEKVMSPLEREGITDFGIVMNDRAVLDIHKDEVASFGAELLHSAAEIVSDSTSRRMLLIESLTFKDGNKWRVNDGALTYHASIEDKEFLDEIDSGKRFGKGDVLIVDLRQIQTVLGAKLATESLIVKVLEHRQSLQQSVL
ncbi:hypothetical protein DWV00_01880 [Trinickia dinghuensis]|uniref:Uncharacterized protein n=2 Tax=Trinickia dinghuensis TaxID=2291023 RepID=A0A3D8K7S5_9BURK|nr:hypothetical protein DWV00_01880 [Trinickia dinghuensis]